MRRGIRINPSCSVPANSRVLRLRNKIDRIDIKIVELLNKRATYSLKIGNEKHRCGIEVEQPLRESEIINNIINHNTGPIDTKDLLELYVKILESSKTIQKTPNI